MVNFSLWYATVILQIFILSICNIHLKGSVKEPNMFHNYETQKITRKASDAEENLQL